MLTIDKIEAIALGAILLIFIIAMIVMFGQFAWAAIRANAKNCFGVRVENGTYQTPRGSCRITMGDYTFESATSLRITKTDGKLLVNGVEVYEGSTPPEGVKITKKEK
jgi:hypothetical protein